MDKAKCGEKMKAIILAAGTGERLKGVVDDIPKPMIKIKGKSILEHNIEWLKKFGIKEIYINLHHLPQVIQDSLRDGKKWRVKISYSYEPKLLGTAGGVREIIDKYWNSVDVSAFLVVYGDNLLNFDLNKIIEFHKLKRGMGTICLYRRQEISQSGIAVINDNDKIIKFIEKPNLKETISNLINTGVYIFEPEILNYIPKDGVSDFGKDIFPEVIERKGKIYGIVMDGELIAVDTPGLLQKAVKEGE